MKTKGRNLPPMACVYSIAEIKYDGLPAPTPEELAERRQVVDTILAAGAQRGLRRAGPTLTALIRQMRDDDAALSADLETE